MTVEIPERKIFAELPESLVGAMLQMNSSLNAGLANSLRSLLAVSAVDSQKFGTGPSVDAVTVPRAGKYSADFLGVRLAAWTLPEMFAQFVDLAAYVAPEAIEKLAGMRSRNRRYVSRNREGIHPGRSDLDVTRTASGWWISKNIGQVDLARALEALAQAAGLNFGADVKFPAR